MLEFTTDHEKVENGVKNFYEEIKDLLIFKNQKSPQG